MRVKNFLIALSLLAGTTLMPVLASAQTTSGTATCVNLTSDLSYAMVDATANGAIFQLQTLLHSTSTTPTGAPYLAVNPTGAFWDLTRDALILLQTNRGLTATGVADSATRTRIRELTGCATSNSTGATASASPNFTATPSSGSAPLQVNFTFRTNTTQGGSYRIVFGDEQASGNYSACPSTGTCSERTVSVSHTYSSAGSYTARLIIPMHDECVGTVCTVSAESTLGTRPISVSASTGGTSSGNEESTECVAITRTLSIDDVDADNNGEVTALQQFLVSRGVSIYPEALVTGYFGAKTERAVQRFQSAQGIVSSGTPETTGYGQTGPTTRARIATLTACTDGSSGTTATTGTSANAASVSGSASNNTVTATYTNLPANSYIVLKDLLGALTNRQDFRNSAGNSVAPVSGSGSATVGTNSPVSSGTYYLDVVQSGGGSASRTVAQSATFRVGASASPLPTASVEMSGGTITVTYANLPQKSYFQVMKMNGGVEQGFDYIPADPGISGDGTRTISSVPNGTYYIRVKQYVEGADPAVALSAMFVVGGTGTSNGTGTGSQTQTCNAQFRQAQLQTCASGVFSAQFGTDCDWEICPYGGGTANSAQAPVITVNGVGGTANPPDLNIASGAKAHVSWSVTPAGTTCRTSDGTTTDASAPLSAEGDIGPYTSTKTFSMTCTNRFGSASKTLRINVAAGGATNNDATTATVNSGNTTFTFSRSPRTLSSGQSMIVSWSTANANSLSYSCTGAGSHSNPAETLQRAPYTSSWDTNYNTWGWKGAYVCTWTVRGSGGTATYTDSFEIRHSADTTATTESAVSGTGPAPVILYLTQDPVNGVTQPGGPFSVSWDSSNANSCKLDYSSNNGQSFTVLKANAGKKGVQVSQMDPGVNGSTGSPFNQDGVYMIRLTCTGNGNAVSWITHTVYTPPQYD